MAGDGMQQIQVLDYWHKVEFFQPYDLQKRIDDEKVRLCLYEQELTDTRLPWLAPNALSVAGGRVGHSYRYDVYLGLFDKSELTGLAEKAFPEHQNELQVMDWSERLELEGLTCFAKLPVSEKGIPDFTGLSLSTLPWALGKLRKDLLEELCFSSYETDVVKLREVVKRIETCLNKDEKSSPMGADALRVMLQGLASWADFAPMREQPVIAIELKEIKQQVSENALPDKSNELENPLVPVNGEDKRGKDKDEPDFGILNSFFIRDIEWAMSLSRAGKLPSSLLRYLTGQSVDRIDLNTPEGEQEILATLHPKWMNAGRWPSDDAQSMSLMQQYAVNRVMNLMGQGIFSVNGPPGTGKTTMLRDIIADNLVRRADVLSNLTSASAAFTGKRKITFQNGENATISLLKPELLGYEMVVVSSNNAAVENISKELPQKKTLGSEYADIGYLRSVADKLAAEHNEKEIKPLREDELCWGLISGALGNYTNRERFNDAVAFIKAAERKFEGDEETYQTLWEWRKTRGDKADAKSFGTAKAEYREARKVYDDTHREIVQLAELDAFLTSMTETAYCQEVQQAFNAASDASANKSADHTVLLFRLNHVHEQIEAYRSLINDLEASKPAWWKRWSQEWNTNKAEVMTAKGKRSEMLKEKIMLAEWLESERLLKDQAELLMVQKKEAYEAKIKDYRGNQSKYRALAEKFSELPRPRAGITLDDSEVQKTAFWQGASLNCLRSKLFVAAMTLQEAWLRTVLQNGGGFGGNFVAATKLIKGNKPVANEDILPIWQSLFMVVPVVSSTFSSVERQFAGLEPGSLGWVFIDEAGQAIPQAAVGALLRARRAVVVGDPLQIEPVFTTSPGLCEGMGKQAFGDDYARWSPTTTSVQKLADEANPFGVYLEVAGTRHWLGSPLRIHRRCKDKMFSIANRIAYQNSMIHGGNPHDDEDYELGPSCWIHLPGKAVDRQFVSEQGVYVQQVVARMYAALGTMPDIYVISPFRKVKEELAQLLRDPHYLSQICSVNQRVPSERTLKDWVKKRVGTVHSFQGKEVEAVLFVLGADHATSGSVGWASSKPNLLNVALTRAKRRVYLIGNHDLWSDKQYFDAAAQELPRINHQEFLRRQRC